MYRRTNKLRSQEGSRLKIRSSEEMMHMNLRRERTLQKHDQYQVVTIGYTRTKSSAGIDCGVQREN
jgi:hypothetical protein